MSVCSGCLILAVVGHYVPGIMISYIICEYKQLSLVTHTETQPNRAVDRLVACVVLVMFLFFWVFFCLFLGVVFFSGLSAR